MTQEQIQESNRLIAEFLGYKIEFFKDYEIHFVVNKSNGELVCTLGQLKYHSSWDWLMPVVEKIESLDLKDWYYKWEDEGGARYNFKGFSVEIEQTQCIIWMHLELDPVEVINESWNQPSETKMEAVYKAVVEFVNWYNERSGR